jgi:hypothetical protein
VVVVVEIEQALTALTLLEHRVRAAALRNDLLRLGRMAAGIPASGQPRRASLE